MTLEVSISRESDSLESVVVKLNDAYSSDKLESYKALGLKDSHEERTTRNIQWGPQMRT